MNSKAENGSPSYAARGREYNNSATVLPGARDRPDSANTAS